MSYLANALSEDANDGWTAFGRPLGRGLGYAQRKNDAAAVVNLMDAERVAPQIVRYNFVARDILRTLLKRERRTTTPGLRALATRAGVLK